MINSSRLSAIFFFILLVAITAPAAKSLRFTGIFLEEKGHIYIVQDPHQAGPAFEIQWKKGARPAKICLWNQTPHCSPSTVYFEHALPGKIAPIAVNARIGTPEQFLFPPRKPTSRP